jgi:SAM-dependent methyltransferase
MRGRTPIVFLLAVLTAGAGLAADPALPPPDPALGPIQDQIATFDTPHGYYATTYRRDEALYWASIPQWMRGDAAKHKTANVLDIGCGYGTLLALAADVYHAQAHCMDVVHYMPGFGQARGFHFTPGNIQIDPVPPPGTFDVILMTEVLEHFNFDPVPTLKKILSALAPGGVFFLSTPDAAEWGRQTKYYSRLEDLPSASSSIPFIDDHVWIYSREELLDVVQQAGFVVSRFAYSPGVGHRHFNLELRRASP